jgi:hypothetical protein
MDDKARKTRGKPLERKTGKPLENPPKRTKGDRQGSELARIIKSDPTLRDLFR